MKLSYISCGYRPVTIENAKLLRAGSSNWDYYLNCSTNAVLAIAKPNSGAQSTYFGSMAYFKRMNPT